jgi:hypothetical protein
MNGPGHSSQFSEGSLMPKQKKEARGWSPEVINSGEDILSYIKTSVDTVVVSSLYAQASIAARALGILGNNETFKNLSTPLKTYLEYVWWQESPEGKASALKKSLATLEEEWFAKFKKNPSRHEMVHPDDEETFNVTLED